MSKRTLALLLSLVLVLSFTAGCTKKEKEVEEELIKPVVVEKVLKKPRANDLVISGNVKPGEVVKLSFKVPGMLESVNVKEGDNVVAGQVLMSVNSYDLQIANNAATAQYNAIDSEINATIASKEQEAKSNLEFINTQLERVKRLHEKGAVATKTVEELELKKEVVETKLKEIQDAKQTAQYQLEQAGSLVDLTNSKLDDTVLASPINGTVVKKLFESGENVVPGLPVIAVGSLDTLEVEFGIADKDISKVKEGQDVKVLIKGLEKEVPGRVSRIEPIADLETRTFGVIVEIDNKEGDIKPGMIANVIVNLVQKDAITIPINAIIDNAEGTFVFTYDLESETVTKKPIEVGEVFEDTIEVTGGLEPGENIVVKGQYRLNDGEKVKAGREQND